MTQLRKLTPEEWANLVREVLAHQPELAGITVQAMQEGILAANDRLRDRLSDVSLGLVEAINTKLPHVRRDHDRIVRAIEASNVHPTKWSDATISRERAAQDAKRSARGKK